MLTHYNIKNYEEFKELFSRKSNDGTEKFRRNKHILNFLKDPKVFKWCKTYRPDLLKIRSASELYRQLCSILISTSTGGYRMELMGYVYYNNKYYTDELNGVTLERTCKNDDSGNPVDVSHLFIRYINGENERVFQMRAGKMFKHLISCSRLSEFIPEATMLWLCEEFTSEWGAYAKGKRPEHTLYVDGNFRDIYRSSRCRGNFHSCMTDGDHYTFYQDAIDASAAYLKDSEGKIIARCIVYNKVYEKGSTKIWRLAERQYCTGQDNVLKKMLVNALIEGGYIDGYKQIGVDCHANTAYVDNEGHSLSDKEFYIDCHLHDGDALSYQDSFIYYYEGDELAYNCSQGYGYEELDSTDGYYGGDEYDDYHDRYVRETTTVYYHGREMQCDSNDLEDFYWIESDNSYHHEDDVTQCPVCGEYYVTDDGLYSDVTRQEYCCCSCLESDEAEWYEDHGYSHATYSNVWVESENELVTVFVWNAWKGRYDEMTATIEDAENYFEPVGNNCYANSESHFDQLPEEVRPR